MNKFLEGFLFGVSLGKLRYNFSGNTMVNVVNFVATQASTAYIGYESKKIGISIGREIVKNKYGEEVAERMFTTEQAVEYREEVRARVSEKESA